MSVHILLGLSNFQAQMLKLSCTPAALHHAAEGGHLDVVAKLVIAGCNVSRYDSQGMSPGHLAGRHGYHQVLDKLLLAGFALDMQGGLTALHGSVGTTALHIAAQHGHQQVIVVKTDSVD